MKYQSELLEGQFIKRYKRFFTDVELPNGETVTAHCPNTGSMKGLIDNPTLCRVTHVNDPSRKLQYTLQQIKTTDSWVGVNTGLPNKLVEKAWTDKALEHWKDFNFGQMEVKLHDKTRIDMVLWKNEVPLNKKGKLTPDLFDQHKFHFVEVKNVTLVENRIAKFPDAVTTRGQKHVQELMDLVEKGHTGEFVFTIQRTDCKSFSPAIDIDPEYSRLLKEAHNIGVKITPLIFEPRANEIELLNTDVPIIWE